MVGLISQTYIFLDDYFSNTGEVLLKSQTLFLKARLIFIIITAISIFTTPVFSYAKSENVPKNHRSTPELIEEGRKNGKIDEDTAYPHLAYSLSDDKKNTGGVSW
jgi:hypothetical protein